MKPRRWTPRVVRLPDPTKRVCAHMDPQKKTDPTICRACLAPMERERSTFDAVLARASRRATASQQAAE